MARRTYGTGSVEQRRPDSWRVTAYLGRDPLTGKTRRRRFTVRGTKRDAEKALREALSERDSGVDLAPGKITLAEWLPRWLELHRLRRGLADTTTRRYDFLIRKQIVPALGHVRLQDIRPSHIAALYSDEGLSPGTRRKCHVVVRRALADAVRAQLIARNPADAVDPPADGRREQRSLSDEEVRLLVEAARSGPYDAPLRITLATGLRQGELLALRWDDVDLRRSLLRVVRGVRWLPGRGAVFAEPKTKNGRRTVELSEASVAVLRRHRREQSARRLRRGPAWLESGLVFPSAVGTPWEPNNFYRGYRAVVDRSGIAEPARVNWHSLRHTAATIWIRSGADLHAVSRRLGHSSAAFTMDVYGHLLPGQQRRAAEAADHLISG